MKRTLLVASAAFLAAAISQPAWSQKQIDPNIPMRLFQEDEDAGLAKVKTFIRGCANDYSVIGTVKYSMKVNPDGSVANVTMQETPDRQLGACISRELWKAKFRKTNNGGSFTRTMKF